MSFPPEEMEPPVDGMLPAEPMVEGMPDMGNPLEGRLPEFIDYSVKLTDEARKQLGRRVCEEIARYEEAVAHRRENCRDWRKDFELLEADGEGPWEGANAVRAPYTAFAVQNHISRLKSLILGSSPVFSARARTAAAQEAAPIIEEVEQSLLDEADFSGMVTKLVPEMPLVGNAAVGTEWEIKYRRLPKATGEFDEAQVQELVANGMPLDDAIKASVKTDKQGRAKLGIEFENVPYKDGVRLWVVPFEQCIWLPATAKDEDGLFGIGEYVRLRGSELSEGAKTGKYLKKAVDKLLERQGDALRDTDGEDDWEEIAGVDATGAGQNENNLHREYECAELDWWDDLNGDGECEWYILAVHLDTQEVLRVQYNPAEHGMSRYVPFGYLERPGKLIAASIAERCAGLQEAATVVLNGILDLMDVLKGNSTSFLYDFRSGIRPGAWKVQMGVPKYVNSIEGVRDMPGTAMIPPAIVALMNMLNILKQWVDLATATSNTTLGSVSENDNTLGEAKMAFATANEVFGDYARAVLMGLAKVADRVRWLSAQYGEGGSVEYRVAAEAGQMIETEQGQVPGREVWVTGEDGQPQRQPMEGPVAFGKIPAQLLKAAVDLVPTALGQIPDREGRLKRDAFLMELALKNPVIGEMRDVLTTLYGVIMDDMQFPQRDKIMRLVQANLQAMQMAEQQAQQMQQVQMLAGMQQQEQQGQLAQEQQRAGVEEQEFQRGMQQRKADQSAVEGILKFATAAQKNGGKK